MRSRHQAIDDVIERLFRLGWIEAAQHVVCAKRDNGAVDPLAHGPVQALEPARGRIAGDAGIVDSHVDAARPKVALKHSRQRRGTRQLVAGGQTIAQRNDSDGLATSWHRHDRGGEDRQRDGAGKDMERSQRSTICSTAATRKLTPAGFNPVQRIYVWPTGP